MPTLHGRIIELWNEGSSFNGVIITGSQRQVFCLASHVDPVSVGSIVKAEIDDTKTITALTKLGEPSSPWDPTSDALRWRTFNESPNRLELLFKRQQIIRVTREDLYNQGFLEVQPPLLVPGTCPDLYIDSIGAGRDYLVTSTEYQLKRLIIGGVDKIFSLTQNFRSGDIGQHHNPEFTMLEWARSFETLAAIEADVERFTRKAFLELNPRSSELHYGTSVINIAAPWERLTVREAFERYLGVHVSSDFSLTSLQNGIDQARLSVPESFRNDAHALVTYLIDLVQPKLGAVVPTFLREWPAFMTSSAALDPHNPAVAERSELFIAGLEIADGFPFLQDVTVQEQLFSRELERRTLEGKEQVTLDARYVEALGQGMPPGAGMALGIDRLVMLLTGQSNIRKVLTFAWDER